MDSPVVIAPGSTDTIVTSQLGGNAIALTLSLNALIQRWADEYPDGYIVGYELAGGGESAFLAELTLTQIDPGLTANKIHTGLALAYALEVGGAGNDEATAARYAATIGPLPPGPDVAPFPSGTLLQFNLLQLVTDILGNTNFELVWRGARVGGTFGRKYAYLAIVEVIIPQLLEAAELEAVVRRASSAAAKRSTDPLARSLADRLRWLSDKKPADRAKILGRATGAPKGKKGGGEG